MKNTSEALQTVTGSVRYGLMNDYMFRAVFQESNEALRHLLSALLNVPYEEIETCEIMNPIILGETIDDKTCVMDIKIKLNNQSLINLEMQTGHFEHWEDRSLFYLARLYCNIRSGQDYRQVMPAVHVGILARSPFEEVQKLYSEYLMTNTDNQHVFSKKFSIRMLDLSQIDKVPEAERKTELYQWTCLFKATTWEEIRMLSEKNEYLQEAASHLRRLSEEEKIQMQCEARERYEMDMATMKADGVELGLKRGLKQGAEQGMERMGILIGRLMADGRMEDVVRVSGDSEFRKKLLEEEKI